MIKGIGIDLVDMDEIRRYLQDDKLREAYLYYTFGEGEIKAGKTQIDEAEYFATRFAAKEACFKAIAPLLPEKTFDLRIIETLNHEDGSPYVHVMDELQEILNQAEIQTIHISITTENEYACAFVVCE